MKNLEIALKVIPEEDLIEFLSNNSTIAVTLDNKVVPCHGIDCSKCKFSHKNDPKHNGCTQNLREWLKADDFVYADTDSLKKIKKNSLYGTLVTESAFKEEISEDIKAIDDYFGLLVNIRGITPLISGLNKITDIIRLLDKTNVISYQQANEWIRYYEDVVAKEILELAKEHISNK